MEIISFPLPHTLCLGADGSRLFTSRRSCLSLTVGELTVGGDAHRNQKIAKSGLWQTSDGGKLNIQMSSCSLFAFRTSLGSLIVSPKKTPAEMKRGQRGSSAAAHERELQEQGWKSQQDFVICQCRRCSLPATCVQVSTSGVLAAAPELTERRRFQLAGHVCLSSPNQRRNARERSPSRGVVSMELIPGVPLCSQLSPAAGRAGGDPARPRLLLQRRGWGDGKVTLPLLQQS